MSFDVHMLQIHTAPPDVFFIVYFIAIDICSFGPKLDFRHPITKPNNFTAPSPNPTYVVVPVMKLAHLFSFLLLFSYWDHLKFHLNPAELK